MKLQVIKNDLKKILTELKDIFEILEDEIVRLELENEVLKEQLK